MAGHFYFHCLIMLVLNWKVPVPQRSEVAISGFRWFLKTIFFVTDQHFGSLDMSANHFSIGREKANKCKQCDYATIHASSLRTHLKIHTGEKANKCNQCDYASSQAGNLRTHLKIHSGVKTNRCNQCEYASFRADNLRQHLKMHSGEKLNKCNQWDYASSQARNLRRQMKKHTGEKSNK